MNKNNGGSAFPMPAGWNGLQNYEEHRCNDPQQGMTLRDWLAGRALPAVVGLIGIPGDGPDELWDASIAARCFALADAMLAERAKQ